jgi:hypothetical protein
VVGVPIKIENMVGDAFAKVLEDMQLNKFGSRLDQIRNILQSSVLL